MSTIEDFAGRLCSERKRLGLTQAQFADACGVKAASQFLYEKGNRTPNAEYLMKASKIGVYIGYLFDGNPTEKTLPLPVSELGNIYKKSDDICRDSFGRLLDLEHRVNTFIDLVQNSPSLHLKCDNS